MQLVYCVPCLVLITKDLSEEGAKLSVFLRRLQTFLWNRSNISSLNILKEAPVL